MTMLVFVLIFYRSFIDKLNCLKDLTLTFSPQFNECWDIATNITNITDQLDDATQAEAEQFCNIQCGGVLFNVMNRFTEDCGLPSDDRVSGKSISMTYTLYL